METKHKLLTSLLLACFAALAAGAEPGTNASLGSLHIPSGVKVTLIDSQRRHIEIMGTDEPVRLQAGPYGILRWSIERRDEQGDLWRVRAQTSTQGKRLDIVEGQDTELAVGEPVHLLLYKRQEGRGYRFTCNLKGRMGEPVEISNRRGHAIPPQLLIANADSSYQRTISFHFG